MEERVAVAQVLLTAEFKWALSVFIQLSGAKLAQVDGPGGMGNANASVEELVLALGGGGHFVGVGTDEISRPSWRHFESFNVYSAHA